MYSDYGGCDKAIRISATLLPNKTCEKVLAEFRNSDKRWKLALPKNCCWRSVKGCGLQEWIWRDAASIDLLGKLTGTGRLTEPDKATRSRS